MPVAALGAAAGSTTMLGLQRLEQLTGMAMAAVMVLAVASPVITTVASIVAAVMMGLLGAEEAIPEAMAQATVQAMVEATATLRGPWCVASTAATLWRTATLTRPR